MIRSLLRILVATAAGVALLSVAAFVLVRQPSFARVRPSSDIRASAARLRADVAFLTGTRRDGDDPDGQQRVVRYLIDALQQAGVKGEKQAFVARKKTYRNVIARFGEGDGRAPLLVVGAHYDSFGNLPGADDNASGTAALLELARLLALQPPPRPVVLVFYCNEEPPFFGSAHMGSAVHAQSLGSRAVEGMISLEMIGYFRGAQRWDSWVLDLLYPDRGTFIGVAGGWADRQLARRVKAALNGAGIEALSFTGPRSTLDASDHRNYWSRGWPAVMVTDTAYLRNPHYHTARDTADTLDYVRMARVVDGILAAL